MKICFIIPTYNDEISLKKLIDNIINELKDFSIHYVIVDDCSSDNYNSLINVTNLDLIRLEKNQGSQKAISTGLKYVNDKKIKFDYLIIMDSDGEDRPEDLRLLISKTEEKNNHFIIFASRKKRMEILTFKFFYFFYKLFFRILTGKKINFGNYCCIPESFLKDIIKISFLEKHFPASIIKSKIKYSDLPCDKGKRYFGDSKMSFKNLFKHGFKAFSIFFEEILIRYLLFLFINNFIFLIFFELNLVIKINLIFFLFTIPVFIYLYRLSKQ